MNVKDEMLYVRFNNKLFADGHTHVMNYLYQFKGRDVSLEEEDFMQ